MTNDLRRRVRSGRITLGVGALVLAFSSVPSAHADTVKGNLVLRAGATDANWSSLDITTGGEHRDVGNLDLRFRPCGNGVVEAAWGEECDGGACCSPTCKLKPAGIECRPASGLCDVAETCSGTAATCPADDFAPPSQVCRSSAGACDVADHCPGNAADCGPDLLESAGTSCRPAVVAADGTSCDLPESCSGFAADCPSDEKVQAGQSCRAAVGACDLAETCDGTGVACPADGFASGGTVCRAAANACDQAELCTGASSSCPSDITLTSCGSDGPPRTLSDGGVTGVATGAPGKRADELQCAEKRRESEAFTDLMRYAFDEVSYMGPGIRQATGPSAGPQESLRNRQIKSIEGLCNEPLQGSGKNADGCTVQMSSGQFVFSMDLLQVKGRNGHGFSFGLTYRTQPNATGRPNLFANAGAGWSHSYEHHLQAAPAGSVERVSEWGRESFARLTSGDFVSAPGRHATLTQRSEGAVHYDVVTYLEDGRQEWYPQVSNLPYDIQSQDQKPDRVVDRITWPNGDTLRFLYTDLCNVRSVTDHHGRVFELRHRVDQVQLPTQPGQMPTNKPVEHLVEVIDPEGRTVKLDYCSDVDEPGVCARNALKSVDQFGRVTRFEYHGGADERLAHNVTRVIRPGDTEASIVNTYGEDPADPGFNRVATQTCGAPQPYRFSYAAPALPQIGSELAVTMQGAPYCVRDTTVTYPTGSTHRASYRTTMLGHIRDVTLSDGTQSFTTTYTHDVDGHLLAVAEPDGTAELRTHYTPQDATQVEFMKRGRVIEVENKPSGTQAAGSIVKTTYTHVEADRLHHLQSTITRTLGSEQLVTTQEHWPDGNLKRRVHPTVTRGVTAPQTAVETFEYNGFGQVIRSVDPVGVATEYQYGDLGGGYLIERVVDPTGLALRTRVEPDRRGNPVRETRPDGIVALRVYTAYDELAEEQPAFEVPGGSGLHALPEVHSKHQYDQRGRLIRKEAFSTVDNAWLATTLDYDLAGNKRAEHQALGNDLLTRSFEYDALGHLTREVSAEGRVTEYEYDGFGRRIRETRAPGTLHESTSRTLAFHFDSAQPTTQQDANGNLTHSTYDAWGRLQSVEDALGGSIAYTRDLEGRVKTEERHGRIDAATAGLLSRTHTHYDERGRTFRSEVELFPLHGSSSPVVAATATAFDAAGRAIATTDPKGRITTTTYDAAGRATSVTQPDGDVVATEYDAASRPTRVTSTESGRPFVTTTRYDALGRATEITDSGNNTTTKEYDSLGRVTRVIDANGNLTLLAYDAIGRLIEERKELRDAQGAFDPSQATDGYITTRTAYDRDGLVRERYADEDVLVAATSYTARGQRAAVQLPDGAIESFEHDAAGNLVLERQPNGTELRRTYDALHRLTTVERVSGPSTLRGTTRQTFDHNGLGLVIRATDDNEPGDPADDHVATFVYDSAGRILSAHDELGGDTVVTGASYDEIGNLTSLTYPGGRVVHRSYDDSDRVTDVDGTTLAYQGDRIVQITSRNGAQLDVAYDDVKRPSEMLHGFPSGDSMQLAYTYDRVGNVTSRRAEAHTAHLESLLGLAGARTDAYQYSSINEVTATTRDGADRESWSYDGRGNRTSWSFEGQTTSYQSNERNQYLEIDGNAQPFDENGNLLESSGRSFAYDALNRLVAVGDVRFAYGAGGERVLRSSPSGATRYVSLGDHVIEERDASGGITTFVYGAGIDQVLEVTRPSGESFFPSRDLIGSTILLSSDAGDPLQGFEYTTFGAPTVHGAPQPIFDRLFASRPYDAETALYNNRARYYDPVTGRFLNVDPIRHVNREAAGDNWYAYVANNPLRSIDPLGLAEKDAYEAWAEKRDDQWHKANPWAHENDEWRPTNDWGVISERNRELRRLDLELEHRLNKQVTSAMDGESERAHVRLVDTSVALAVAATLPLAANAGAALAVAKTAGGKALATGVMGAGYAAAVQIPGALEGKPVNYAAIAVNGAAAASGSLLAQGLYKGIGGLQPLFGTGADVPLRKAATRFLVSQGIWFAYGAGVGYVSAKANGRPVNADLKSQTVKTGYNAVIAAGQQALWRATGSDAFSPGSPLNHLMRQPVATAFGYWADRYFHTMPGQSH